MPGCIRRTRPRTPAACAARSNRVAPRARSTSSPATGIAPLLAQLIDQQAATGLPPPYLPQATNEGEDT